MNRAIALCVVVMFCAQAASAEYMGTASSISQYNITWFFEGKHEYGTFANGDYWVVGPVNINGMTPDYFISHTSNNETNAVCTGNSAGNSNCASWCNSTVGPGYMPMCSAEQGSGYGICNCYVAHNGWQVNPVNSNRQGFESGAMLFDHRLVPQLPYVANPGESLVKGISINQSPTFGGNCYNTRCLKTAAVLTVVGSVPPDGGSAVFRPPYPGSEKPYYFLNDLRTDLLPSLAPVPETPELDFYYNEFKRVQLDHQGAYIGRTIKPKDNMPDYGSSIAVRTNAAALRLMMNDSIDARMPLLVAYVQSGIDRYHAVLLGQTWPAGGGHEPGRKVNLAFTAVMLDNQGMKNVVLGSKFFSEDMFISQGVERALWDGSGYGENQYWQYVFNDPGYNLENRPDPYGYIDGGMNDVRINGYQGCCLSLPWKDSALVARLIPEIKAIWNSSKFFDYTDRWVNHGIWTQPDPCAPTSQGGGPLLAANGSYQRKCILDPDLVPGSTQENFSCQAGKECGRWPQRHGAQKDGTDSTTIFARNMWTAYRGASCYDGVCSQGETAETCSYDCGQDDVPPSVSIMAPENGSNVSGILLIEANASDDTGVASIEFFVDNVTIGTDSSYPYSITWNSSSVANGSHAITAAAFDEAGNSNSSFIFIAVESPYFHRADVNKNGCIELSELLAFIIRWKLSSTDVGLGELISTIADWKRGC